MVACAAVVCCVVCCLLVLVAIIIGIVLAVFTAQKDIGNLDELLGNLSNLEDFIDQQNLTDAVKGNIGDLTDNLGDNFGDWREQLIENGANLRDNLGGKFNDLVPDDWDQFANFTNVLDNIRDRSFSDFFREGSDPFVGDNSTSSWPTKGDGGLSLQIVNALDENWQTEFNSAIADWEGGTPDSLTLTVERVEVDHTCTSVEGKMVVCNANFGDTGWLGINEILSYEGGFVISSVAKMNEFYLKNAEYPKRQFTMCHEIGHGFGLPHTDENFNNVDLGNCMDYTNQPENNMRPDASNYIRLADLYGTVSRRRGLRNTVKDNNDDDKRSIPRDIVEAYDRAIDELHDSLHEEKNQRKMKESSWTILREHSHGREYERRLMTSKLNGNNNGVVLKASVLFNNLKKN